MARRRWTIALIIICLPILATVITAFRVRDLPRSLDRKEKCEDCDVKIDHKIQSVKIESVKPTIDNSKKSVKEKSGSILRKESDQPYKPTQKFEIKSDEDEDNSDEHLLNVKIGFKQEYPKVSKDVADTTPVPTKSFFGLFDVSDEDDEDDDEDDEDDDIDDDEDEDEDKEEVNMRKIKKTISKKNDWMKESISTESSSSKEDLEDEENDSAEKKKRNGIGAKSTDNTKELKGKESKKETQKIKEGVAKNTYTKIDQTNNDNNIIVKKIPLKLTVPSQNVDKATQQNPEIITNKIIDPEDDEHNDEKPPAIVSVPSQKTDKSKSVTKEKGKEKPLNIIKESAENTKETSKAAAKPTVQTITKVITPVKKHEKIKKDTKLVVNAKSSDNVVKTSGINDKDKSSASALKRDDKKDSESSTLSNDKKVETVTKPDKEFKPSEKSLEESKERKSYVKDESKISDKISPLNDKINEKPSDHSKAFQSKSDVKFKTDTKYTDKHFTYKDAIAENLHDSEEITSNAESNLKQVSDALHRRNLLKSEFEDFYAFFPTFAPNFSHIHNSECRRHGQILLRQLRGMKIWALNMLDATAKIPSGILQGNGIQLGDFDQCLSSRARVQLESGSVVKVQGKYCLARVEVKAEHPELELPVHLAQAKNLIRSRLDDPGHFVPRFSTLSWGVCVPSPCDPEDAAVVIRDAIKHYQRTSGVVVRVKVDPDDCHVEDSDPWWQEWLQLPTLLTLSFYGVVVLVVLVATAQDFFARRTTEEADEAECNNKDTKKNEKTKDSKGSDNFISPFSLYHTINKLVAPATSDEISCIHGVRAMATLALLVAHKFFPIAVMPYTNRLQFTETVSSPLWSWCRAGWMYTDCFLLLSGALLAHRISTDADSAAPRRLFFRYIRLTPALVAVVLFYAYVWDHLSSGPMWGTFVTKNAQVCQDGWWWNLLYVQNYFGFEEMCAPQTHQLALDMQLTILGGLIVWAIQVKENLSMILFPALHLVAAYSRYTTVRDHRLTLLAYHGVSVSQLYRTARLSYMSVLHRSTPYLVGLSLGLALRTPRKHGMFLYTVGWVFSSVLWSLVWWAGIDTGSTSYRYDITFAAQYAAVAPIASSLAIAWVIYAVHNESIDFLTQLLCCRPLVFISRLSYALFLCQFIVYITDVATVRSSSEFTVMSLVDAKEICLILLSSTILTLTLVIPMQSMNKLFSFKAKTEETVSRKNSTILEPIIEEPHEEVEQNHKVEPPRRQYLVAHREVLEEIPETEIEYEMRRERTDGLEEILEEEEGDEDQNTIDDDLEIIEEEEGGEECWPEREDRENSRRRSINEGDQDLEEWEWTANGRSGAQHYRYNR